MNPNYPIVRWQACSEGHLYTGLNYLRKCYGKDVKVIFKSFSFGSEKELIFSRAVARFQHLMIIED